MLICSNRLLQAETMDADFFLPLGTLVFSYGPVSPSSYCLPKVSRPFKTFSANWMAWKTLLQTQDLISSARCHSYVGPAFLSSLHSHYLGNPSDSESPSCLFWRRWQIEVLLAIVGFLTQLQNWSPTLKKETFGKLSYLIQPLFPCSTRLTAWRAYCQVRHETTPFRSKQRWL